MVPSARLVSLPVALSLLLLPAACDGGGGVDDDASQAPLELDAAVACPEWTHELTSGQNGLLADIEGDGEVTARILDASNVPPRKGFNTWTVELQGEDGERRDDYQITWICSFMPDHNHTAGPQVSAVDEPGQFLVDRLNLGMNGGWEIPLWVDPVDSGKPAYTRVSVDDFCKPVGDASRPPDMVFRTCVPRR